MLRRSFFLLWFLPLFAFGQGSQLPKYTVATLPAASAQPTYTVQVLDGANDQDCVTGHGTKNVLCKSNGTIWVPVSPFQSLTTNNTSGAATLNLGVLNIPNYNGNSTSFRHDGTVLTGSFAGSPQLYDYDETSPATDSGFITATGHFDTTTGKFNYQVPAASLTAALRMNPGEDATHVFVPFGACDFSTSNQSLIRIGQCDALGGTIEFYAGGLFNHNAGAGFLWRDPVLPSWLPAGNVDSVQLIAWSSGWGTAATSGCGGSVSCAQWHYPPNDSQVATPVIGATGLNFAAITAHAGTGSSLYCAGCDPFTRTGNLTVEQVGLLVQFSGVTNPNPSNALNIIWPLQYNHENNTLGVNYQYPTQFTPILTALLPFPTSNTNQLAWTSDNTQTIPGQGCTGSGIQGSDYAICEQIAGAWNLVSDVGAGGFGVTQVTSPNSSLTFSPSTGHVLGSINESFQNHWQIRQYYNGGIELENQHSDFRLNGLTGGPTDCVIGQGDGNTPTWAPCPGTIGPGTVGYLSKFATTATVNNSHIDDGATTAGHVTITEPTDINSAGASQATFTYNATPLVPGGATDAVYGVNASGQAVVSEASGAESRICTAGNAVCAGSGSFFELAAPNTVTVGGHTFSTGDVNTVGITEYGAGGSLATPTLLQSANFQSTSSSDCHWTGTTTAGSALYVEVPKNPGLPSSNHGESYVSMYSTSDWGGSSDTQSWLFYNMVGGATTITISGSGFDCHGAGAIAEIGGALPSASLVDGTPYYQFFPSNTSTVTSTITTTTANDFIFTAQYGASVPTGPTTYTAISPFTFTGLGDNAYYRVATTTGVKTAVWNMSGTGLRQSIFMFAIKAAASSGQVANLHQFGDYAHNIKSAINPSGHYIDYSCTAASPWWNAYSGTCGVPYFAGTSAAIGGSALTAGQCATGTVTITGTATTMTATASPAGGTSPGAGFAWQAQVTSANTVTVSVCAMFSATPTSTTYNVKVQ